MIFSWMIFKKLTSEISFKTKAYNFFQPTLLNSYLRSYYGTTDGKYRITIDRELRYFSFLNAKKFTRFLIEDQAVVLELKYDETLDEDAAFIMQYIPFRYSKSSKYVTGLNLLGWRILKLRTQNRVVVEVANI